jgi:hypothetical protein
MAVPSREQMKLLLADPRFLEALRVVSRGYRWRWERVSGNRWLVVREPYHPLLEGFFEWERWLQPRETTPTERDPAMGF